MKNKHRATLAFILFVASLIMGYYSHNIIEYSKTIGDVKGGNYGNPVEAMKIEATAFKYDVLSAIFLFGGFIFVIRNRWLVKIPIGFVVSFVLFVYLIFLQ